MLEVALEILNTIQNAGYKAYIVGGFPRDLYLKRDSVDVDICTNATPKELNVLFKDSILPKKEYGGITVVLHHIRFEITTFRKEIKYENNRFPVKIKYIDTLIDDLERRDFTINTLCMNSDGEMIDLLNAKKDLDNHLIKCVGKADKKIKEDILRSLRAIRFATVLNFTLDEELKKSIMKHASILKKLSYDRKKEELDKIFSNLNASYGLSLLRQLNLMDVLELHAHSLVLTSSSLGVWAQFENLPYIFSSHEKEIIDGIKAALKENILDPFVLYHYGLYICTLAGEIKNIDRAIIVAKYNQLPINNKKDIVINNLDIGKLLHRKPDFLIKNIMSELEKKIVCGELENTTDAITSYIRRIYES